MSGIAHLSLVQIGLCGNVFAKIQSKRGLHVLGITLSTETHFQKAHRDTLRLKGQKKYTSDYKIDYNNYLSVFQLLLIFQNVRIFNQNSDYNDILLARSGRIKKKNKVVRQKFTDARHQSSHFNIRKAN